MSGSGKTFEQDCNKYDSCTGFSFSHTNSDSPLDVQGGGCLKKCIPNEFGGFGNGSYDYWEKR